MSDEIQPKCLTVKVCKVKNRRVYVSRFDNGDFGLGWKILKDGKPKLTRVQLSRQAAIATARGIFLLWGETELDTKP